MTSDEMVAALECGQVKFVHKKSRKIYVVDPSQREVLKGDEGATVIAYPEKPSPRKRGRAWSFISPRNLEISK